MPNTIILGVINQILLNVLFAKSSMLPFVFKLILAECI